jgi:mannose-6-phosphate isomerase-like protein (cupin superfamily)
MALHVRAGQVPANVIPMKVSGGELRTRQVFGLDCSLIVASRSGGYHSVPHFHDCEQLNYVQAGEIWVFVEDTAYPMRAGDFLRIPAGAVHWAWNRGRGDCELIEVHSPGLLLPGADGADSAPRLLAETESGASVRAVPNEWSDPGYRDREAAALAAHGVTL